MARVRKSKLVAPVLVQVERRWNVPTPAPDTPGCKARGGWAQQAGCCTRPRHPPALRFRVSGVGPDIAPARPTSVRRDSAAAMDHDELYISGCPRGTRRQGTGRPALWHEADPIGRCSWLHRRGATADLRTPPVVVPIVWGHATVDRSDRVPIAPRIGSV